jgi:hypothetical protein
MTPDRPAGPSSFALSTNDLAQAIGAGLLLAALMAWLRFPAQLPVSEERPDTPDSPDLEQALIETVEDLRDRGYTPHTMYVHPKHAASAMLVCARFDLTLALDDTYPSTRAFVRCHGEGE